MATPEQLVWLVENGAYWKAVWQGPDGRRHGRSLGARAKVSRRAATVKCRQIEADVRAGKRQGGEAPKLSAWLATYRAFRTDVGAATQSTYRECAVYLLAHFRADPPIDRLTRADAAAWHAAVGSGAVTATLNAAMAAGEAWAVNPAGRPWRAPAPATLARHVRTAKLTFAEAVGQDLILFNPFDRLKGSPPKPARDWREVTRADLDKVLDACPNAGWRCLFALCRLAGLRLREAVELAWADVDWAGNRMRVNESVERETTKRRYRTAPIDPARCPGGLAAILREAFDAAPAGAKGPSDGVAANNLRRTALGILRRSGIGAYAKPFHTLRKCRISELAMHYPQGVLEDWVGHDAEVSRRHYQRVPDELYATAPVLDTTLDTTRPETAPKAVPETVRNPVANPVPDRV